MSDLLLRATALVALIADHTAAARAASNAKKSPTAELAALAIEAELAGEADTVRDSLKGTDAWKASASTYSGALGLARYLKAGNTVPRGTRKENFIINDKPVEVITAEHLEALALFSATGVNTTVPAIVKHAKAVRAAAAELAEKEAASVRDAIAAYLGSEAGKAEYPGMGADALLDVLKTRPLEYARVVQGGMSVIEAEAAAAKIAAEATDAEAEAAHVLDYIAACGPAMLAMIADAVAARTAPAEAEAAAA